MATLRFAGLVGSVALSIALGPAVSADPGASDALAVTRRLEADLVAAVERARGETVSILSRAVHAQPGAPGDSPHPLRAVGTGVLVRQDGRLCVLTSLHVVDSEDRLEAIAADGASYAVHVARREPRFDLGLLAFDRPPTGLRGLDLSEMGGDTEVGTWVFATGNPFFLALDGHAAVSLGMVSGVRPAAATNYIKGPILQHDAEINPGSSGGPLWSTTGRLLGINGTIATRSRAQGAGPVYTGASFAVPIEDVRRFVATGVPGGTSTPVAPAVVARGPVPPPVVRSVPFLGIRTRTQVGRSGSPSGARVTGVIAPSPVAPTPASAGIRPGDVITRFSASGRAWTIRSADDVERAVARSAPGSLVSLRFVRGGRVLGWTGRLAEIR